MEHSGLSCTEVSSVDVQIVGFSEYAYTTQSVEIDENSGFRCNDAENPLGCYDYKVRFCCEGCCAKLKVFGDPEVTDYYENYPGIYEIIPDEEFNGYSQGFQSCFLQRTKLFSSIMRARCLCVETLNKAFTEKYLVMTKSVNRFMAMVIFIIGVMLAGCLVLTCSHIHIILMV